ncbi:hypothetical protein ES708_28440 [subsurface metagenome]
MAKVKAPLFSLEARGALAKTVVYFPWKGLNAVREYVIPSNPKSPAQLAQRSKFIEAVENIHASQRDAFAPLASPDVSAYALLASTFKTPRTWFNAVLKAYVESLLAGKGPLIWQGGELDVSTAKRIIFTIKSTAGNAYHADIRYGTSKTALLDIASMTSEEPKLDWIAENPYSLDAEACPTEANKTGYTYICIVAGTSGTTEPVWPTRIGGTVEDATVTWECKRCLPYPWTVTISTLVTGQKYFLQPIGRAGEECEGSDGGIYHTIVT